VNYHNLFEKTLKLVGFTIKNRDSTNQHDPMIQHRDYTNDSMLEMYDYTNDSINHYIQVYPISIIQHGDHTMEMVMGLWGWIMKTWVWLKMLSMAPEQCNLNRVNDDEPVNNPKSCTLVSSIKYLYLKWIILELVMGKLCFGFKHCFSLNFFGISTSFGQPKW